MKKSNTKPNWRNVIRNLVELAWALNIWEKLMNEKQDKKIDEENKCKTE